MIKSLRWALPAVLAGGVAVWLVLAGSGDKVKVEERGPEEARQSSRHRTGEVEKHRATPLEKRVTLLERQLEDKKADLSALAKTRSPIHLNPDGAPPPAETPEAAAMKTQATHDFEEARKQYLLDRQELQKLKLELAEEQAKAKVGAASR